MAADDPGQGPAPGGDQPDTTVQRAIDWFTRDTARSRQVIEGPDGPIAPGQLLASARYEAAFDSLLPGAAADHEQTLVQAQAAWLIRRMPSDHATTRAHWTAHSKLDVHGAF